MTKMKGIGRPIFDALSFVGFLLWAALVAVVFFVAVFPGLLWYAATWRNDA